jgi:hypothetical protein
MAFPTTAIAEDREHGITHRTPAGASSRGAVSSGAIAAGAAAVAFGRCRDA